jgi:hypothetical protein
MVLSKADAELVERGSPWIPTIITLLGNAM